MSTSPIPFPALDGSFSSDRVKWRGVAFDYGDRVLIIPALPISEVARIDQELAALAEPLPSLKPDGTPEDTPEHKTALTQFQAARQKIMRAAITTSLRRNYTVEQLSDEDIIDFLTYENFFDAFMAAQGTYNKEAQRVRSAGELKPETRPL
jgi:hypothetical protein